MNRFIQYWVFSLLLLFLCLPSPVSSIENAPRCINIHARQPGPSERIYFHSPSGDVEKLLTFRKQLISQGARNVNCFLPFVIVCELPATISYIEHLKNSDIVPLQESEIRTDGAKGFVCGPQWVKQCYKIADKIPVEGMTPSLESFSKESAIHKNYIVPTWETVFRPAAPISISSSKADPKGPKQNSEFMLGDILAQIVYPESNGPGTTENWTDQAISSAASGVVFALLYFQESYTYTSFDFVIRNIPRAETSLEPIQFIREDQAYWITDVMNKLGYQGSMSEYLDLVNEFNNEWRIEWGTDWVFTAFIANSANDFDHCFGTQLVRYIGFSELGGPHMAVPYPAGYWGITPFKQVFIHELGRVFWAHYEHVGVTAKCTDRSGYLNYKNWNKTVSIGPMGAKEGCSTFYSPALCIMNFVDAYEWYYDGPPCMYTSGMIGLVDIDPENGVPDAVDAPPEVVFETSARETTFTTEFQLNFQAVSHGVPNQNPLQSPSSRITYALPVKDVRYTVNGIGPFFVLPVDGKSDETVEDFIAHLSSLIPGFTNVEIYARNTMGATSDEYIKELYYVGLSFQHFRFEHANNGIGIEWNMMGETFDAKFDLHRIDPGPVPHDSIIVSDVPPYGPPNDLFQSYRCFDANVVPGNRYLYYVESTFSFIYRGEELTFTNRSSEFEVHASLYLAEGQLISAPSPNPFRDQTWISINIPPSYQDVDISTGSSISGKQPGNIVKAPSVLEPVPTPVNVIIYNVLGQRVKDLYIGSNYATILTIPWNGTNNNNESVPSGIYFLKARVGSFSQVQKVMVIR